MESSKKRTRHCCTATTPFTTAGATKCAIRLTDSALARQAA
jgi:hypothetical protein